MTKETKKPSELSLKKSAPVPSVVQHVVVSESSQNLLIPKRGPFIKRGPISGEKRKASDPRTSAALPAKLRAPANQTVLHPVDKLDNKPLLDDQYSIITISDNESRSDNLRSTVTTHLGRTLEIDDLLKELEAGHGSNACDSNRIIPTPHLSEEIRSPPPPSLVMPPPEPPTEQNNSKGKDINAMIQMYQAEFQQPFAPELPTPAHSSSTTITPKALVEETIAQVKNTEPYGTTCCRVGRLARRREVP
ncbi:hypothetical protein PPYR_02041 [Photinus pyralis]|uniref:Uncharacterized protein n=1 Tax=Photinus pyralis TaxID=7054 RepID=A0A5N4B631_PHOPY|nr:uncharacterized protein LOC116160231 isoform X2 [Photinus pyralis]KAB0805071.1 hypothetical protein PPYR_02041 [Photinus pyralis]